MANETAPSSPSQNSPEPRGLLRTLVAAFSGVFFGLFLSKVVTPSENPGESAHPQDSTHDQANVSQNPSTPIRVVIDSIPPTEPKTDKQKAEKKREESEKQLKNGLEIVAALIAFGLLVANILLWCSTKEAAKKAAEQLDAFKDSQAGVLVIEDSEVPPAEESDGFIHLRYKLTNRGNSVIREINSDSLNGPSNDMEALQFMQKTTVNPSPHGFSLGMGQEHSFDVPLPPIAQLRKHPQEPIFFVEKYVGSDIFGRPQSAVVCFRSYKSSTYIRCLRLKNEKE